MKKNLLILFFILNSNIFSTDFLPLFRISYDFNLGYTYGVGLCISNSVKGGAYSGIYTIYNYNRSKNKTGSNISLGFQGGYPPFSGGYAINRMLINKDDNQTDIFWGLEVNPHFIIFDGKVGIMSKNYKELMNKENYKFNFSKGLGFF